MKTFFLKFILIFIAFILVILINGATTSGSGKPGLIWPFLSVAFVGFLIGVIKWKPKKDKQDEFFHLKKDNSNELDKSDKLEKKDESLKIN